MPPPCWLGKKSHQVLPSGEPCMLQYQPVRQDVPTSTTGMNVTNFLIGLRPTLWERNPI